jgi:GntR family transcriptional regulator
MASDEKPVYLRLRDIIAAAILDGTYRDGDALPSVRSFAAQHGANPLTVAKAYQSFQDEDLVIVRRGVGMFVAPHARERLRRVERDAFLGTTWPEVRAQMDRLGLSLDDLLACERD